jgi:hypothetical protein
MTYFTVRGDADWVSGYGRLCSLIPGLGVKLFTIIFAGPTVLSAVEACPPHDGDGGGSMLKARSPFRTLAKNRTISPQPPSRQGRLFPPCRRNPVISLYALGVVERPEKQVRAD